jgi:hypothetical protein
MLGIWSYFIYDEYLFYREQQTRNNLRELSQLIRVKIFKQKQIKLMNLLPGLPKPESINSLEGCSLLTAIQKFSDYTFVVINVNGIEMEIEESEEDEESEESDSEESEDKIVLVKVFDNLWEGFPTKNTMIIETNFN